MTDKQFYTLFMAALDAEDCEKFVSAWEAELDSNVIKDRTEVLKALWSVAHLSIKEMRTALGLSQAAFAQRLCIPKRTVECWETESASRRECSPYIRLLIAQVTGLYQRPQTTRFV